MKINNIIKKIRINAGYKQEDIAIRTETSAPYVCKLEKGGYLPSPKFLIRFCRHTNLNYQEAVKQIVKERMEMLNEILDKKYNLKNTK